MLFHLLCTGEVIIETTSPDECICSVVCTDKTYGDKLFDRLVNLRVKKKDIEKVLNQTLNAHTKGERLVYKLRYVLQLYPPADPEDVSLFF